MSAYPIHHDAAQTAERQWVPIDEAAELLGKTEGTLRRLCSQLSEQGQAKKMLVNGAHKWHIHTIYSPRLRRRAVETDDQGKSKLQELLKTTSVAKLKRAQADAMILRAFRKFKADHATDAKSIKPFIETQKSLHGRCPGRSRLFEMDKTCPCTDDHDGLVYALIDRRGRPGGDANAVSDAAWLAFCDLYLTPQQWSIAKCWRTVRGMAEQEGWAWPSLSRIKQLKREKLDPSMCTLKREGRDAWSRQFLAPMEQDPNAWDAGQCWESDNCTLDIHCRVIKGDKWVRTRPVLTAWMDRRTRLLVGWQIVEEGNQFSIRAALMNALKTDGISVPEIVWLDNGKDFMARSLTGMTKADRRKASRDEQEQAEQASTGLLCMLGIEPHFARAYNHNGKARIERFFGTMHGEFDKEFKSYAGYRPGMIDKLDHQATQKDVMNLPTLDEVREKFEEYASWYNCRSEHRIDDLRDPDTMERLSPIEFYTRYLPTMRATERDKLILLEDVWSNPLKVHKWGVSLRVGGGTVRYGELEPALEPLVGTDERVFVSFDPDDMGQVNIWSSNFKHLCTAMQNGRYGGLATDRIKRDDLKAGFAKRKAAKQRLKQKIDVVTGSLSDAELHSDAAREREIGETKARQAEFDRTRDPNDMPNLRLVRPRIDADPDDIQKQQQRKAVGAEDFVAPEERCSIIDAARDLYLAQDDGDETFEHRSIIDANLDGLGDIEQLDDLSQSRPTDFTELGHDDQFEPSRIMDHLT